MELATLLPVLIPVATMIVGWLLRHWGIPTGGTPTAPTVGPLPTNSHPVLDLLLQKLDARTRTAMEGMVDNVLETLITSPATASNPAVDAVLQLIEVIRQASPASAVATPKAA